MHLVLCVTVSESQKWPHSKRVFSQVPVCTEHELFVAQTLALSATSVAATCPLKHKEYFTGQNSFSSEISLLLSSNFGCLHSSSLVSGIPDTFSHAHHLGFMPSFGRNLATYPGIWNDCTFKVLLLDRQP